LTEYADKRKRAGLLSEYVYFLKRHRMWWLAPTLLAVFILGFLVVLGGSAAAPLIYALF